MHEMSLAINIVEIACQTAKQNGAEEITSIEIDVGQLAGVLEDSLSFCFKPLETTHPLKMQNWISFLFPVKDTVARVITLLKQIHFLHYV
jgi:Zn finger protein HypA/HybF involved in hydrogenase expression